MKNQPIDDRARMAVASEAAAYMRWVETRKGQSSTPAMTQQYVKGALDRAGYSYDADEPQIIEVLALSLHAAIVEQFIKDSRSFDALDRASKTMRRLVDGLSFVVAAVVGVWLRYNLEASWYVAVGVAMLVFIALPFAISRYWALYLIRRAERVGKRLERF
jgi:hypothetical protein